MKKILLALIYSLSFFILYAQPAQDKARMEKERQAIQMELKEIQSVYEQVKGQKQETIGQLSLLQKKMNLQDQYIGNINKEIRILGDDIYLSTLEINKLQRQLDTLKSQYARSIVYAYKNRSTYDYLNFIFSASTFNDALKRVTYLRSYRTYRQQQVAEIQQTQALIAKRKDELINKKGQKNSALQNQEQQLQILASQKKEKDEVVAKLKSKESDLSKQIAARKKRDMQLRSAIAAVIRREIEAARKRAEDEERARREREALAAKANAAKDATTANSNTASTTTAGASSRHATAAPKREASYLTLNEKDVALAANFQSNKGKLPWPVDNGYVCIHYGTYEVPGTLLKGDNPGLTICTPAPGATVKAVFDGEVSAVSNLGDGMTVMIRHGKYFSIYSNLSSASVSKGTAVHTGQAIGRSGTDDEGGSGGKVDFLLMVETKNVNPEPWLRGR